MHAQKAVHNQAVPGPFLGCRSQCLNFPGSGACLTTDGLDIQTMVYRGLRGLAHVVTISESRSCLEVFLFF